MSINYRQYNKQDIPQILSLWQHNSDFGTLSRETFESWYLNTKYESSSIIIAENGHSQIIGQMVFMPSRMVVGGRTVKAMKVAAPILDKNFRFSDASDHPIFNLFLKGVEEAKKEGVSVVYLFPARGWLRAMELYSDLVKWQTATFNTFSINIKSTYLVNDIQTAGFIYNRIETFNEEYDELWERAVKELPIRCGIVRNKEWLRYRLGDHFIIEARGEADNSLKGYLAIKKNSGLVVDMLATTLVDLKQIFIGSIEALAKIEEEKSVIHSGRIVGMYTEVMASILENIDFDLPNYKFDFGCCSLDETINIEQVQSSQWFMMPDV